MKKQTALTMIMAQSVSKRTVLVQSGKLKAIIPKLEEQVISASKLGDSFCTVQVSYEDSCDALHTEIRKFLHLHGYSCTFEHARGDDKPKKLNNYGHPERHAFSVTIKW